MDVARVVGAAFADAQRSYATHKRASAALASAFTADAHAFLSAFTHCLNRALVVFRREPAVERVVAFVARFAGESAGAGGFSCLVLEYLVDQTRVASKAVRFRSCQMLGAALVALPEDADVGDELWGVLLKALLARAGDKLPRVRAAAACALCRMQASGLPGDDPVAAMLVALMSADSSAAVRKAALDAVAVNEETLPVVMRRTRDVKEDVRRAAYRVLARKLHPDDLDADGRVLLLRAGLRDRSAHVRRACAEEMLVEAWLKNACDGDVFALVDLLGGAVYEEEALLALRVVFSAPARAAMVDAIEIDVNNLTPADTLVLRAMCDVKAAAGRLEKFMPTTSVYAEVLKYYSTDDYAVPNLLALSRRVDMSDEAGRREVETALRDYFLASSEVKDEVIPNAVSAMRTVMLTEDAATRALVEIILDGVLPAATQGDELSPKEDGAEREDEDWASMRALTITKELLRDAEPAESLGQIGGGLFPSVVQHVVVPRLSSPDAGQRHASLECLALFCLLDKSGEEARRHMPLFVQACRNDHEDIQELALHALADLFLVFDFSDGDSAAKDSAGKRTSSASGGSAPALQGLTTPRRQGQASSTRDEDDAGAASDEEEFFSANGDSPNSRAEQETTVPTTSHSGEAPVSQVVSLLSDYVTHADDLLRTTAIEALSRLLFSRRVAPSAKLLSRLLIAFHNPVNEENEKLQQCLSVFFPAFAFSAPEHRLALERSFLPIINIIRNAPATSPLTAISPLGLAQFVLYLTNPASVPTSSDKAASTREKPSTSDMTDSAAQTHERIAETILNELLDMNEESETENVRLLAKILVSIRLVATSSNLEALKRLRKLSAVAADTLGDRRSTVQIRRFHNHAEAQSIAGDAKYSVDNGDSAESSVETEHEEADAPAAVAGDDDGSQDDSPDNEENSAEQSSRPALRNSSDSCSTASQEEAEEQVDSDASQEVKLEPMRRKTRGVKRETRSRVGSRRPPLLEKADNSSSRDSSPMDDEAQSIQKPSRRLPARSTRSRRSYAEPELVVNIVDSETEEVVAIELSDDEDESDDSYMEE